MSRRYEDIVLANEHKPLINTREKAERMARRHDEFEASRLPLFKDQLRRTDPKAYLIQAQAKADALNFLDRKFLRKARLCRFLLTKHLSAKKMAALERRRLILPDDPVYEADFWRTVLKDWLSGTLKLNYQIDLRQKPTAET